MLHYKNRRKTMKRIHRRLKYIKEYKTIKKCKNPQHLMECWPEKVTIANSRSYMVSQFCYVADMLGAGGGYEVISITPKRSAMKTFRELLPLLTSRAFC